MFYYFGEAQKKILLRMFYYFGEANANFFVCDLRIAFSSKLHFFPKSCILSFLQIQKEFQTLTAPLQLVIEQVSY